MQPPLTAAGRPGAPPAPCCLIASTPLTTSAEKNGTSAGQISTLGSQLADLVATPDAPSMLSALVTHCWIQAPWQPLNHLGDGFRRRSPTRCIEFNLVRLRETADVGQRNPWCKATLLASVAGAAWASGNSSVQGTSLGGAKQTAGLQPRGEVESKELDHQPPC